MKKKIAFFTNSISGGGAEKVLQTLIRHLNRSKYDVTLYSVVGDSLTEDYPCDIDYRTIYKTYQGSSVFGRFLYRLYNKIAYTIYTRFTPALFYRLFIRGKYDVEVAFIEGYSTRIVSGSTNPNSKKLAWVHIDLSVNHWTQIAYHNDEEERTCYRAFDSVIAVSDFVMNVNNSIFPGIKNSCCIYNPVDSDEILSKAGVKEAESKDHVDIVSSGRFTNQKAFDRLLKITKRLVDEGYPIKLKLLGDGEKRGEFEDFITENQLQNVVTLYGFQKNPYKIMNQCDLFVCSSITEGFSTVITESLILGLPVVSTEVPGIREQLGENCEYGIITDNNTESLYQGIKDLLEHPERLSYYRQKSQERSRMFQIRSLMNGIEKILE